MTSPSADPQTRLKAPTRGRWAWAACLVATAVAFRHTATILVAVALAWLVHRILVVRDRRVLACAISTAASLALFEYAGGRYLERRIAETYQPGIDHRLRHDPAHGINSDGIRCPVEAGDFTTDTVNVILLGDSFVYGWLLDDARDTFPAQLQDMIDRRYPSSRVRVINFGWPSSSPLLTYRLLRDIGAKYKPRFVIQFLDMSDFHDDLRYRDKTGLAHLSPTRYLLEVAGLGWIWSELRDDCRMTASEDADSTMPADHYFVVNEPLDKSLPYMQETEINLMRIHGLCEKQLHAGFAAVMLPRGFQYSDRESPRNWEAPRYPRGPASGPWVLEPFRWLEELKSRVPFHCYSLLEDFKHSGVFPTCFERDPHWTRAGNEVAARGVLRVLESEKLLGTQGG